MSSELQGVRSTNSTMEGRLAKVNTDLEEEIKEFWKNENVSTVTEVVDKLNSDQTVPAGFSWFLRESCLVICLINMNSFIPKIDASVVILADLSVTLAVKCKCIKRTKFKHISQEKIENFTQIKNLMSFIKCHVEDSKKDDPEIKNAIEEMKESLQKCIDSVDDLHTVKKFKFINEQLSLIGVSKTGRRYSPDYLVTCYLIYATSPNAYKELRKQEVLCLPSEGTLRTITK